MTEEILLFKCPECHRISRLKGDVDNRYCNACKEFFGEDKKMKTIIIDQNNWNVIAACLLYCKQENLKESHVTTVERIDKAMADLTFQADNQDEILKIVDNKIRKRIEDERELNLVMRETQEKLASAIDSLKCIREYVFESDKG